MQRVERRYLLLGGCNHIPIVLLRSHFMSSKLGQKRGRWSQCVSTWAKRQKNKSHVWSSAFQLGVNEFVTLWLSWCCVWLWIWWVWLCGAASFRSGLLVIRTTKDPGLFEVKEWRSKDFDGSSLPWADAESCRLSYIYGLTVQPKEPRAIER